MRLCFISYEYPPDTGIGGIATYVYQVARLFSGMKFPTQVICASHERDGTIRENDFLTITRVKCNDTETFRKLSHRVAADRYLEQPFDLIEVPEYGAEGLYIKEKFPDIPLIVKLHTPKYLIKKLNDHYYDRAIHRRIKNIFAGGYNRSKDPEYKAIQFADHILSPSLSLKKIVSEDWSINEEDIIHAPNPYFPSEKFLKLDPAINSKTVIYIGRLETRKGVFNLAKAVPLVLRKDPDANFIFLGKDSRGPLREASMKAVMLKEMGAAASKVQFMDAVPMEQVHTILARAGTCVFPSLWENFPNVCLEGMAAARKIVASKEGGMVDMLEDTGGGIFVDPHDVQSIAEGILQSISQGAPAEHACRLNRQKVVDYYGAKLVNELVALYQSFMPVSTSR